MACQQLVSDCTQNVKPCKPSFGFSSVRPDSTFYSQNYRITESVITESGSFRDAQTASHLLEFLLHLLEDKLCERRGQAHLVLPCREHSENIVGLSLLS